MSLAIQDLSDLPSPFYRVAVKALVFNDNKEILLVQNDEGTWELPGGGWEHNETLEECLRRELAEEANAELNAVNDVQFVFSGQSDHGWHVLRIVVAVTIINFEVHPGDDMIAAKFFSKDEFLKINFHVTDAPIVSYADQIWAE